MKETVKKNERYLQVLIIDPWGIKETGKYTKGLCLGISHYTKLTLITNALFVESDINCSYGVNSWFFPISERMSEGKPRNLVRGFEYIYTYFRILHTVKKNQYDVIHINWLLQYKIDKIFLKSLNKHCTKLVYTAHNVLPHIHGEKYVKDLRVIYDSVDRIILHGQNVKDEFSLLFPELVNKVYLQKHGCNLLNDHTYDISKIDVNIMRTINKYKKRFIAFGRLNWSKGIDRATNYWLSGRAPQNVLLIVAGKLNSEYTELCNSAVALRNADNIIFLNEYISDNFLNYLVSSSSLILLLYRHASMSGVIFTAADFSKPVLCTQVGALEEYLVNEYDSFVVPNDDEEIYAKLDYIISSVSEEVLSEMGNALSKNISSACNWFDLTSKLVHDVYQL